MIEEYVQIKSKINRSFEIKDFFYSVIRFCKDSSDVNCLKIAMVTQSWLQDPKKESLNEIQKALEITIDSKEQEQHNAVLHSEFAEKGLEMIPIKYTVINEFNILNGIDFNKLKEMLRVLKMGNQ